MKIGDPKVERSEARKTARDTILIEYGMNKFHIGGLIVLIGKGGRNPER